MKSITVGDVTVYYETDVKGNITYSYLDAFGGDLVAEVSGCSEFSITSAVQQAVNAQSRLWREELSADYNHDFAKVYFGINPFKYEAPGIITRFFTRLFGV